MLMVLEPQRALQRLGVNFDASGTAAALPVVRSSYNIHSIQRIQKGVIKITFASGVFGDNNYVAVGNSNAILEAELLTPLILIALD